MFQFSNSLKPEKTSTKHQNLQDTIKVLLRGMFISISAYTKKLERHQVKELTLHVKELEKQQYNNPKISRKKEFLKKGRK